MWWKMIERKCEWILQKSRVYFLGEGTEEKELGEERICTAPLQVRNGSQAERRGWSAC
jgi:hypothetical protein